MLEEVCVPTATARRAGKVEMAVDPMKPDLNPMWEAGPPTDGRDVDGPIPFQGSFYIRVQSSSPEGRPSRRRLSLPTPLALGC